MGCLAAPLAPSFSAKPHIYQTAPTRLRVCRCFPVPSPHTYFLPQPGHRPDSGDAAAVIHDSATDQFRFGQVRASIHQVRDNSQNGRSYSGHQPQHATLHATPSQPSHQQQHHNHLTSAGSSASPRSSMPAYAQAQGSPASATPGSTYVAVTQPNDRPSQTMPQSINSRTAQSPALWFRHVLTETVFSFKPSPFHDPISLLADVKTCDRKSPST